MISSALNSLTAIEMDNDTIIGIIQSAIEKDKVIEKNFKEDSEYTIENGVIVDPVKYYDTVDEFKNQIDSRWRRLYDIAKSEDVYSEPPYSISIESDVIKNIDGIDKQFAEYMSIKINTKMILNDIKHVYANEIYDMITEFSGVDIGSRESFIEYIYGIDEIDLIKNNKINKNDEFFSKSSSYKHPMTSSVLINTTIYGGSNISINIRIPVIAEGKGYI
ncbi:hypothetical protein ACQR2U_07980 [Clostridium perfringens]